MYLFLRIGHLKKIILKGRGFRCGSDEKMKRMWFGLEIDVVGLPPLVRATFCTIGSGQYTLLSGRPVQTGKVLFEFKFTTTGIECQGRTDCVT